MKTVVDLMRIIALWVLVIYGAGIALAQPPERATYSCAVATSVEAAIEAGTAGTKNLTLLIGDGIFRLTGDDLKISGGITGRGEPDSDITAQAGNYFSAAEAQSLMTTDGETLGMAAFANDANGIRVAYFNLNDGKFFMLCFDEAATAANLASVPATQEPPKQEDKELIDSEKIEKYLASTPKQQGKETKIFGPVSFAAPDAGHYICKTVEYNSDGTTPQRDFIGSSDAIGFDLFADGAYRLQLKDKFEDDGASYQHNPQTGAFVFDSGTLSVYLKFPIPIRKDLNAEIKNVSLLYASHYDYENRLDELILCTFSGPTQTQSPNAVIAARAEKNLHPPEPGSARIAGLYYSLTWSTAIGPNFTSYQVPNYAFRYFQDNGFVWLGDEPRDGDYDKLDCTKPMVDARGDPTCTTYNLNKGFISKSTISLGHDAPVTFEHNDDSITTDGTSFMLIAPMQDLKLSKTYNYFSYTGIAAISGSISFTAGGQFQADSSVGIAYTTPEIGDTTTTVTGYDEKAPVKGRYTLNDHSIEVTSADGKLSKMFFAQLAEGMYYMNGRAYLDR